MTPYPTDAKPIAEVAKRLGVHQATLHRWVKAGQLEGWRVGPGGWQRKRRIFVSMGAALALAVEPVIPRNGVSTARQRSG